MESRAIYKPKNIYSLLGILPYIHNPDPIITSLPLINPPPLLPHLQLLLLNFHLILLLIGDSSPPTGSSMPPLGYQPPLICRDYQYQSWFKANQTDIKENWEKRIACPCQEMCGITYLPDTKKEEYRMVYEMPTTKKPDE